MLVTDHRPYMVKKNGENKVLRCSFCNKDQNDVRKLIAGPTVCICDESVEVCNDIIADDNRFEGPEELGFEADEGARCSRATWARRSSGWSRRT